MNDEPDDIARREFRGVIYGKRIPTRAFRHRQRSASKISEMAIMTVLGVDSAGA